MRRRNLCTLTKHRLKMPMPSVEPLNGSEPTSTRRTGAYSYAQYRKVS